MRRDFTYIDDIVRGVVACLDGPPVDDGSAKAGGSTSPHALYNIGNSRSEDLMRVVELLEQETGSKALLDPQPMQIGDVKDTFADISAIETRSWLPARTASKKAFRVRRLVSRLLRPLSLPADPPAPAHPGDRRRRCLSCPTRSWSIAQCTSGIVGSFPALNARPARELDEWLHEITEARGSLGPRPPRAPRRAVRGQPDRPPL